MGWKNLSYWLRGGIVASVLYIIYAIFTLRSQIYTLGILNLPGMVIGFWVGIITRLSSNPFLSTSNPKPISNTLLIIMFLINLIIYFILGSIIGIIIKKIKSSKK